ncbi:MAG: methylenetetrahydrofolate reductase [Acidimicrobiales bacterium]|jgi:5,10-methylenetetrahydrofolate reductase
MKTPGFELVCEIEPPTRPDLKHVRHQIGVLSSVSGAFLIPDNHIGRATVSSVAVAHEVEAMGGRSIACLNARDRNLLGFQRDLLTAAAYGVDQFLLVRGDEPRVGGRTSQLTVQTMLAEARAFDGAKELSGERKLRLGAVASLGELPDWKREADFLCVQVGFSMDALLRWRDEVKPEMAVYAGVMVLPSATMARSLRRTIPDMDIPDGLIDRLDKDPRAGVEAACELVLAIRDSKAFEGVHLIPVSLYRAVAARLEQLLGEV